MMLPSSIKTRFFASFLLVFTALGAAQAAPQSCVSMKVVAEQRGELDTYFLRGDSLPVIGAQVGEAFSLVLRNQCDSKLLARVYVDGLNVVDGQPRKKQTSGYVLEPYKQVQIKGWRKSAQEVAQFYFTRPSDSYASRIFQSTRDLGLIELNVFEEQASRIYQPSGSSKKHSSSLEAPSARAQVNSAGAERVTSQSARSEVGTGHGERIDSPVNSVKFQAKPYALQIYRVRYLLENDLEREIDRLEFAPDPLR